MMLVLGSGVAGLCCAVTAAARGINVMLVTPGRLPIGDQPTGTVDAAAGAAATALAGGNTALAQGGIAAALGADDHPALHAADTIAAGVGLVDPAAATLLANAGAQQLRQLLAAGFPADRDSTGAVAAGLEAAHRRARIVHAGEDHTGATLHTFLCAQLASFVATGQVQLAETTTAVSLLEHAGAVSGAVLRDGAGRLSAVAATAVVLATGGYAALYAHTSNHPGARGAGIALAARLGAVVADLEFVQFHPTVLAGTGFLISEAVRGAGAVLRDHRGARYLVGQHDAAELAPRDVVARITHRTMREAGLDQVWLDATGIERAGGAGTLARRFPALTSAVRAQGWDWAQAAIPVAPAAHYSMGGVVTDLDGRTSLPGLFAAGEVACTGVHGANRLASNSLLEGLVFGVRAGHAAAQYALGSGTAWQLRGAAARELIARAETLPSRDPAPGQGSGHGDHSGTGPDGSEAQLLAAFSAGLGIEREAAGMTAVVQAAARAEGAAAELAGMVATAALARTESRGAHQRADFPSSSPIAARRSAWQYPRGSAAPPLTGEPLCRTAVPLSPVTTVGAGRPTMTHRSTLPC